MPQISCSSIHDLPDELLQEIFRHVGTIIRLPLPKPSGRIHHPLQCALVCKRWSVAAPSAVKSLILDTSSTSFRWTQNRFLGIARLATLTRLEIRHCQIVVDVSVDDFVHHMTAASPQLEELVLKGANMMDIDGNGKTMDLVSSLALCICKWRSLRKLDLGTCLPLKGHADSVKLSDAIWHSPTLEEVCLTLRLEDLDNSLGLLDSLQRVTSLHALQISQPLGSAIVPLEPICERLIRFTGLSTLSLVMLTVPCPSLLALTALRSLTLHAVDLSGGPHTGVLSNLSRLTELSLFYGSLSSSWACPSSLQDVKIIGTEFPPQMPESLSNLLGLNYLIFVGCASLRALQERLGDLTALKTLTVLDCDNVRMLPATVGSLHALQRLIIIGAGRQGTGLSSLPSSIRGLRSLLWLNLTACCRLQELADGVSGLVNLRNLTVSGCTALTALPSTIGALSKLRILDTSECPALPELLETMSALVNLTSLDLHGCVALKRLPSGIGRLETLQRLNLQGCSGIEAVPEGIPSPGL